MKTVYHVMHDHM